MSKREDMCSPIFPPTFRETSWWFELFYGPTSQGFVVSLLAPVNKSSLSLSGFCMCWMKCCEYRLSGYLTVQFFVENGDGVHCGGGRRKLERGYW